MGQRPPHVVPPAYLAKSPPVPLPDPAGTLPAAPADPQDRDPVRYGDWEWKGIAIDF